MKPDPRDMRFLKFIAGRQSELREEEIADDLGFGSPKALYRQLNNDGFPVCASCGAQHYGGDHTHGRPAKERKARGSQGEAVELPPVEGAALLFDKAVRAQRAAIGGLPFVRQWFKDGRFVTEVAHTGESGRSNLLVRREDYGDSPLMRKVWAKLCRQHGQNPNVEEFRVPIDHVLPGGADWFPHDSVTALVCAVALAGGSLKELVEKLHPHPEEANLGAIEAKGEELRLKARQLAAMVRSAQPGKRGPKEPAVSPEEQQMALVLEWFEEHAQDLVDLDPDEAKRLRDLRLPRTEE